MTKAGKTFVSGLLASCLLAVPGCASLQNSGPREFADDAELTAAAVQGSNAFALDLYRQVANDGDNLFFSPISISLAMGYAYRGADGQTAEQMADVMHYPAGPVDYLRAAGALDRQLSISGEGRELRSANAFWVHDDLQLQPDYVSDLSTEARGAFNRVNFTADPEAARQAINGWVAGETNDRIEELISEGVITPKTAAVLVNAIYWKADWLHPFSARATRQEPFFLADGTEIEADLMDQGGDFRGIERGSVKLIELPYAGEEVSMVAILPEEPDGLDQLERSLTAGRLESWLDALDEAEPSDTELTFPKMSLDWNADLVRVIERMGAPLPFSGRANFDRMALFPVTPDNLPIRTIGGMPTCGLTISNVIHQANIDVDEEGSEAAAATAVVMSGIILTSAQIPPPPPPFIFRADHPFMFLLRDNRSGAILFMGRLVDPRQEETDGPPPDLSPIPEVSPLEGCPARL